MLKNLPNLQLPGELIVSKKRSGIGVYSLEDGTGVGVIIPVDPMSFEGTNGQRRAIPNDGLPFAAFNVPLRFDAEIGLVPLGIDDIQTGMNNQNIVRFHPNQTRPSVARDRVYASEDTRHIIGIAKTICDLSRPSDVPPEYRHGTDMLGIGMPRPRFAAEPNIGEELSYAIGIISDTVNLSLGNCAEGAGMPVLTAVQESTTEPPATGADNRCHDFVFPNRNVANPYTGVATPLFTEDGKKTVMSATTINLLNLYSLTSGVDPRFDDDKIVKIADAINSKKRDQGLWPITVDKEDPNYAVTAIRNAYGYNQLFPEYCSVVPIGNAVANRDNLAREVEVLAAMRIACRAYDKSLPYAVGEQFGGRIKPTREDFIRGINCLYGQHRANLDVHSVREMVHWFEPAWDVPPRNGGVPITFDVRYKIFS